jgi:hypothetical protein
MSKSAYASPAVPIPDVDGAIVVFLHDFYDSPHIYPGLIFSDFWQWADRTLTVLATAGQKIFVKPHPNQVNESQSVVEELMARHPEATLLPAQATNSALAAAGMACGVTMYGTVAHELAYLGIPVIAAGGNPHMAFAFCHTARSLPEYDALLAEAAELKVADEAAVRAEVLEFYIAHNLSLPAEAMELRAKCLEFWKACHSRSANLEDLIRCLEALRDDEGMKGMLEALGSVLGAKTRTSSLVPTSANKG